MLQTKGTLLGRFLMGLLFVSTGTSMLLGGISNTGMFFESYGLPMPVVLAVIVIAVKLIAGAAMMVGYKTEEAAVALFIFTGLTIFVAHLNTSDINLWKNLAIMGGLLYVMAYGPGDGWKLKVGKSTDMPM